MFNGEFPQWILLVPITDCHRRQWKCHFCDKKVNITKLPESKSVFQSKKIKAIQLINNKTIKQPLNYLFWKQVMKRSIKKFKKIKI